MSKTVFIALAMLLALVPAAFSLEVGEPVEDVGTFLDLPNEIRLQLVAKEQKVIAHFVDAESLVVESIAESIVVEITHSGRRTDRWRSLLKAGPGASMTSARVLPPPYQLKSKVIIRFTDGTSKTFPMVLLNLDKNLK